MHDYPHIKNIRLFFENFSTIESLKTPEARNTWALLLANKNGALPVDSRQRVIYNKDGVAEIVGAMPSVLNLFDILLTKAPLVDIDSPVKTVDSPVISNDWETVDLSSDYDKALALKKWQKICDLLKHPESPRLIKLDDVDLHKVKLESKLKFTLNQKTSFDFRMLKNHFSIKVYDENYGTRTDYVKKFWSNYIFTQLIGDDCIVIPNLIKENISKDSKLGYYSQAIFFRTLSTYGYQRFDDPYTSMKLLEQMLDTYQASSNEMVDKIMLSSPGRTFLLQYFLPNAFDIDPELSKSILTYLKKHNQYKDYIRNFMEKAYVRKWQFIAFFGLDAHFGNLKQRLKTVDHPDHAFAKSVFTGPLTNTHPLFTAVQGQQLSIIKLLTNNGKADYWRNIVRTTSDNGNNSLIATAIVSATKPILEFFINNDPNFLKLSDCVTDIPKYWLASTKDSETFEYLRAKLNIKDQDMNNIDFCRRDGNLSILDIISEQLSLDRRNLIAYIFDTYPQINVTEKTMIRLFDAACIVSHETAPDTARMLLDKYSGNFEFLNTIIDIMNNETIWQNLLTSNYSVWLIDMVGPRLSKPLNIDLNFLIKNHSLLPYRLWCLIKHGLLTDAHDDSGQPLKAILAPNSQTRLLLWMLGYEIGAAPTKDDISVLLNNFSIIHFLPGTNIYRKMLHKDFLQDLNKLEIRLGFKTDDDQATVH